MNQQPPSLASPRRGSVGWVVVLLLFFLAAALLRMSVGRNMGWPPGNPWNSLLRLLTVGRLGGGESTVMDIRLLRVVLASLVGLALASSGVALQALLRNPLAEPFILGLSSGAALGVMIQWLATAQKGDSQVGAILGSITSAAVVYLASRRRGLLDPVGLLLTGVVLGTICGALIMMLNYLRTPSGLQDNITRWMMGYLNETASPSTVAVVGVVTLTGVFILFTLGRAMDVATFSDTEARSMGVHLPRLRTWLFLLATLLAAGAVVLAGPIGFVGMICPHVARLLCGSKHRSLVLASALLGALLLLLADSFAVCLDHWYDIGIMPIGIFTAILGGPLFLWMLHPQLGRGTE